MSFVHSVVHNCIGALPSSLSTYVVGRLNRVVNLQRTIELLFDNRKESQAALALLSSSCA